MTIIYMFSVVSLFDLSRDLVEKPHIVEIFSIFIRYILLLDAACFPFIYYYSLLHSFRPRKQKPVKPQV